MVCGFRVGCLHFKYALQLGVSRQDKMHPAVQDERDEGWGSPDFTPDGHLFRMLPI